MSEKIVQLNEDVIKGQLNELVRGSVEETLNELLEKEAEQLTQAARYERSEALWGSKVSPSTISELNKKAYVHIKDWRNRTLQGGKYPYVYVDGIYTSPELGRRV